MPLCHSKYFLPMRSVQMWLFKSSLSRNPKTQQTSLGVFSLNTICKNISHLISSPWACELLPPLGTGWTNEERHGTPSSSSSSRSRSDRTSKRINKHIKQHWTKLRHGEGLWTEAEGLALSEGQIHRGNFVFHARGLTQRKRSFPSPWKTAFPI